MDALVEVALDALEGEDRAAAQEAVENLHNFAQRQYKNIDLQTTVSRLEKAEEVGQDEEALEQALEDFENSNNEEKKALKDHAEALLGLKEQIENVLASFEEDNNSGLTLAIQDLLNEEATNSAVRAQLDNAVEFLDHNERESAQEALENAVTRLEEEASAVDSSIDSVKEQTSEVDEAIEAASSDDEEELFEDLDNVSE